VTKDVPWDIKTLITLFYFVYVGSESGYSGWISMFGISTQLTTSESSAAYLCSFFWIGLTIGRLLAIPQSLYFTASAMVRFQLGLSVFMSGYFLYFPAVSYEETSVVSLLFGFAMSSIFPLMMIIVTDYGFIMDANTTTLFVVGSTIGEALVPIAIGQLIGWFGTKAFPTCIVCTQVLLFILYVLVHFLASKTFPSCQFSQQEKIYHENQEDNTHPFMSFLRSQLQYMSDLLSLYIARSKAYCGFGSIPKQQHVRFNPVLDVCRLSDKDENSFEESIISEISDDLNHHQRSSSGSNGSTPYYNGFSSTNIEDSSGTSLILPDRSSNGSHNTGYEMISLVGMEEDVIYSSFEESFEKEWIEERDEEKFV